MVRTVLGFVAILAAGVTAPASPEVAMWEPTISAQNILEPLLQTYQGIPVTVTAYNAVASQTDSSPDVAACGPLAAVDGPIVALSRDLFVASGKRRCGEEVIVYLENETIVATVWDTMNRRFTSRVDVLMPTVREARQFGKQQGHLIWPGGQ